MSTHPSAEEAQSLLDDPDAVLRNTRLLFQSALFDTGLSHGKIRHRLCDNSVGANNRISLAMVAACRRRRVIIDVVVLTFPGEFSREFFFGKKGGRGTQVEHDSREEAPPL